MSASNRYDNKTTEELSDWEMLAPNQQFSESDKKAAIISESIDAEAEWVTDFGNTSTAETTTIPALDPTSNTPGGHSPTTCSAQNEFEAQLDYLPHFDVGVERTGKKEYMLVYIPLQPDNNGEPRWRPATEADYATVPGLVEFIDGLAPKAVEFGPEPYGEGVLRVVGGKLGW
ncbi:MAG: hypothetical protein M1824_004786 [Vezdaea acicularis]|nr:MAG: hypothetical protein M1824_004786 [Vezdaea acicularis]